ncbi:MAG: substrate-binding domain-containing protein, partial [Christensenellaceae bacterium]|nr:substrate-binding domain-containing protein [Christensenellaceae bacterium]
FEYEMVGPATAEATSQIEYVEAAVQNGADVIFIAANSNDALNGTFDDAEEAGTRIVIINQDIPGSEDHRTASVQPVDMTKVGVALCDHVKALIGEGKFAVLSATTDAPDQNQWIADMQALIETDSKYAGLELVEVVYGDDQPEKSTTEMEALLNKHPDLDCVVAPTTVGIAAAAKVLQNKGNKAADGIKLTGLGLPSEMAEFVLDGTVSEFKLWNPPMEGYLAIYMAYEMVVNGYEPESGTSFEAGELGKIDVTDKNIIFTIPDLLVYDINNIEEYAAQF